VSVDHLVILAPGLLGASVARAAHARARARHITVWARRAEVRAALRGQDWLDTVADTPEHAVAHQPAGRTLVVLAAPVERIIELDRQIGPHLPAGAIVTDVGSVKGPVCAAAAVHPRSAGAVFIGSHPMAGSEKTGWENGTDTLFEGRVCFVTPSAGTPADAIRTVEDFWRGLGSTVVNVAPEKHDEIVAHISHLPQALATTLACALSKQDGQWRHLSGNGLRDTSRIAGSDPAMWIEIFQQNRPAVLAALERYERELAGFRHALEQSDWPALRDQLARGKQWRDGFNR
jgi:cyclohexadieny/prephenate dehydrogenase